MQIDLGLGPPHLVVFAHEHLVGNTAGTAFSGVEPGDHAVLVVVRRADARGVGGRKLFVEAPVHVAVADPVNLAVADGEEALLVDREAVAAVRHYALRDIGPVRRLDRRDLEDRARPDVLHGADQVVLEDQAVLHHADHTGDRAAGRQVFIVALGARVGVEICRVAVGAPPDSVRNHAVCTVVSPAQHQERRPDHCTILGLGRQCAGD